MAPAEGVGRRPRGATIPHKGGEFIHRFECTTFLVACNARHHALKIQINSHRSSN